MIQAKDHTDKEALNRRLAARPAHLQRMKEEKQKGVFIIGGALLNDDGNMIGSIIILSLPDEASVKNWIQQDPYTKGKAWNEISITPFRVADV